MEHHLSRKGRNEETCFGDSTSHHYIFAIAQFKEVRKVAQRAKGKNHANHNRQMTYLRKGVVMLPTLREERKTVKEGR